MGVIGPGAIMAGSSIGSGEWLLGPATFVRYGMALLWVTSGGRAYFFRAACCVGGCAEAVPKQSALCRGLCRGPRVGPPHNGPSKNRLHPSYRPENGGIKQEVFLYWPPTKVDYKNAFTDDAREFWFKLDGKNIYPNP